MAESHTTDQTSVVLSATTATPQDVQQAALARFEVLRNQFIKNGSPLHAAEQQAASQVDRIFNTHLGEAIPQQPSTTTDTAAPQTLPSDTAAPSGAVDQLAAQAPSSSTQPTPLFDRAVRGQFPAGSTPLYDRAIYGNQAPSTPLYNRAVGAAPLDTVEAMRQRPDFPIHFPEEEHAGPFDSVILGAAQMLKDGLNGVANIVGGPSIPSAFTGPRFLGIARESDIKAQLGEHALDFTDQQMKENRTAAAFIASSLVAGVASDAILAALGGTATPGAVLAGTAPKLGFIKTALAGVASGAAGGAAFGALRPKDQQESLLGAIMVDALLFGGMGLAGGLVAKPARASTTPLRIGVDDLERAGIPLNRALFTSPQEYGKALFEEMQGIQEFVRTGDLARVPDVALADLDVTVAQVPANIGFLRRYFGSPSKWKDVGGPVGDAAQRIAENGGQRMAVALRERGAWSQLLDDAEALITKDIPAMGGGLTEAGRVALIQQRKDAFGKLLDNVFQPTDLPVTVPPNMVRAFQLVRNRLLADRETLRLLVGGTADWGIDAYLPHVFVGDWAITNAETNAIMKIVPVGEIRSAAAQVLAENPGAALRVVPKRFIAPADLQGLGFTGRQLGIFISRAAQALSIDRDEIASVLFENKVARVKPGKKWFGHTLARGEPALEGFETDPFVALRLYAAGATRKIAFHDFEQKATAIIDELARVPGTKTSADALRTYVDRVLGRPSELEESVRVTLQSMARFAAKPLGAGIQQIAEDVADPRFLLGKINQFEAMARLGYSPIAWFTNLTQTLVNTGSAIGWGPTMRGIRLFLDTTQRPQVDALLRALDIDLAVPLSAADNIVARNVGQVSPWHPLYLFNKVETANRAIAALAKYQEQLLKGADIRQALDASRQFVRDTQFDYSLADAPRLLQGPLGSGIFQFKKFVLKELEFMWGLRNNPAALARFHAAVLAIGGTSLLFKLPPYILVDWASGELTGEKLSEHLEAAAPHLARGLPGLAGIDVSGNVSIGLPRDTGDLFGPGMSDLWTLTRDLAGKPLIDLVRGKQGHLTPGDRAQAVATLVPVMARRLMDSYNILETGVVRARGTTQLKFTPESVGREATLAAFGFRSLPVAEEQRVTTTIRRETALHQKDEQAAVQAWAMAYVSGHPEEATQILQDAQADGLVLTHAQLRDALAGALLERSTRAVLKSPPELRLQELQRLQQLQRP